MNEEDLMKQLGTLTDIDGLDLPCVELGDENPLYEPPEIKPVVSNPDDRKKDLEADYMSAREMVHFQQEILRIAMLKQLENAHSADAPRQMEVLATLSTQITNNTKQLLDIHKQMKDNTQETIKTEGGGTNIQNQQVYVGNVCDLLDDVGSRQESRRQKDGEVIDG